MIEVGNTNFSPSSTSSQGTYTFISRNNPANKSGTITLATLKAYGETIVGLIIGIFENTGGSTFVCRSAQSCPGSFPQGTHEIEVNLEIEEGDYIGLFASDGKIGTTSSGGSGYSYASGNRCSPGSSAGYTTPSTTHRYGLSATGPDPVTGLPYAFVM